MNDQAAFHDDPDMDDLSLVVIKEGQVSRQCFSKQIYYLSKPCLLTGIPKDIDPVDPVCILGKPRTVDAKMGAPAPEVRGIQEPERSLDDTFPGSFFEWNNLPVEPVSLSIYLEIP